MSLYDVLGADLLLAAREARMSPGKVGDADQWRALAQEMVRRGWMPPVQPQSLDVLQAGIKSTERDLRTLREAVRILRRRGQPSLARITAKEADDVATEIAEARAHQAPDAPRCRDCGAVLQGAPFDDGADQHTRCCWSCGTPYMTDKQGKPADA